jgi:hypothetical protein
MKTKQTKHIDSHFVSHETPQHQPVPVDSQHVCIEEGHPDPLEVTQDGQGIVSGHSQQAADGSDPRTIGGEDKRRVKPNSKVTLGIHRTSDDGFKKAESRHDHVQSARKENQTAFTKKK